MNHAFDSRLNSVYSKKSPSSTPEASTSLLSLFEEFLGRSELAPATIRNYLADVRGFLRWLENDGRGPRSPSAREFRAYREHLIEETEHPPSTVNRHIQALRVFGRCLCEGSITRQNPAQGLKLVPNGHDQDLLPRVLDYDEIEALIIAVRAGARPSLMRRDYAVIELMLQAGLRANEVAGLEVGDIAPTRDGLQVIVRGASDEHYRQVPLNEPLARALREYLQVRPELPGVSHLFISQRGQPLSTRSIQRLVECYAEAAQLEDICASSLRHTCAKKMLEETRAPHLVALWLGHKHVEALKRYE